MADGFDIRYVAALARLALTDAEVEAYAPQLQGILAYVEQLRALDTAAVPPTAQVIAARNVTREDVVTPGLSPAAALGGAPAAQAGGFRVPRIATVS